MSWRFLPGGAGCAEVVDHRLQKHADPKGRVHCTWLIIYPTNALTFDTIQKSCLFHAHGKTSLALHAHRRSWPRRPSPSPCLPRLPRLPLHPGILASPPPTSWMATRPTPGKERSTQRWTNFGLSPLRCSPRRARACEQTTQQQYESREYKRRAERGQQPHGGNKRVGWAQERKCRVLSKKLLGWMVCATTPRCCRGGIIRLDAAVTT